MTGPYFVYRLFDLDGRLLYIGESRNPAGRRQEHKGKFWWPLVARYTLTGPFADRTAALAYERAAIYAEVPRFNYRSNVNRVYDEAMRTEDLRLMNDNWANARCTCRRTVA